MPEIMFEQNLEWISAKHKAPRGEWVLLRYRSNPSGKVSISKYLWFWDGYKWEDLGNNGICINEPDIIAWASLGISGGRSGGK